MKQTNHQETPHYESSTLPYVCWYQNDFLGGVRGMRAHEIGIYTILLNEMYARGRPLELSETRLARLCGCDKRTFVNVLEMLIQEGKILNLANGLWNKRCESIFQERAKLLEQKSFAGHCSARKRKKINAEIQQLLNGSPRDAERNSEAQKGEEKETPNGVSEKKFLLLNTKALEEESNEEQHPCSSPSLDKAPPHPSSEQFLTPSQQFSHETAKNSLNVREGKKNFLLSDGAVENSVTCDTNTKSSPSSTPVVSLTKSASGESRQEQSSPTSCEGRTAKGTIAKGHRLPTDWQADINAAISEGLSEDQARWQEKKFRDYWQAKSGKEALKVDWQATWRNWYRREIERIKEHQERLAIFSQHSSKQPYNDNDALYRSLINYHTR